MLIKLPGGWELPERDATPESVFLNRRQLLAAAGFLGTTGLISAAAKRNPEFSPDLRITEEWASTGYNNYYEFGTDKEAVKTRVGKFQTSPWQIEVKGLVNKPATFDLDDLVRKFPVEERVYRHRCVEAWSMVVPWSGFPLASFIRVVEPKPEAKFVRFFTVERRDQMPGIPEQPWYPWPYFEALRIDEAMNPLAFVVTGMYGKPVPRQNGAPIRVALPWKYGFKSAKSIVRMEFVAQQPPTFWNKLQAAEYGFYANVNPGRPHPRWSQATEKVIPKMERKATLMYNGYEKWVAGMYNGQEV